MDLHCEHYVITLLSSIVTHMQCALGGATAMTLDCEHYVIKLLSANVMHMQCVVGYHCSV